MADDKKYNGWTNYETWLCNLWFDDLSDYARDCETVADLADHIKETVEKIIDQDVPARSGFVADLINAAMSEINWFEIAEHYEEDLKQADTDDEEDQDDADDVTDDADDE